MLLLESFWSTNEKNSTLRFRISGGIGTGIGQRRQLPGLWLICHLCPRLLCVLHRGSKVPTRVLSGSPHIPWIFSGTKVLELKVIEEPLMRMKRKVKSQQVIAHLLYKLRQAMRDLSEYSHSPSPRWILVLCIKCNMLSRGGCVHF